MNQRMLWRLDGLAHGDEVPALAHPLRVHLAHAELTCVLVQIGPRQQAYLALRGCAGCSGGRCEPACPRDLLARALTARMPALHFTAVAGGLATRPYSRSALVVPGREARVLDGQLLRHWPEARLVLSWRMVRGTLMAGAELSVSADGPAPAQQLQASGWQAPRLPRLSGGGRLPVPSPPQRVARWPGEPALLLPAADPESPDHLPPPQDKGGPARQHDPPNTRAIAERLVSQLGPLMAVDPEADDALFRRWSGGQIERASGAEGADRADGAHEIAVLDPPEPPSIWPTGPGRMRPADVAFLIEQLRTSPVVLAGSEPGVTRRRIAQLLPDELAEYSRQLMLWLHQAAVLCAPPVGGEPFRNPRPLVDAPDEAIAAQLAAAPVPSPQDARVAMQRER
jgi:hypothetical protein